MDTKIKKQDELETKRLERKKGEEKKLKQ